MRIEHKLPPHVAQYAKTVQQQLNEIREQYLMLLGQAKECEQQAALVRSGMAAQINLLQQAEGLPPGNYGLSPDGTAIVAEVPDDAAAAPAAAPAAVQMLNGKEVVHHA